MIRSFMTEARESWQSFFSYAQQTKTLRWFIGLSIVFLYGIRLTQGDIFVDSDIMLTDPQNLIFSWYGHQRFGLVFTKQLFSLTRLLPFQQNALFLLTDFLLALGICFCLFEWSGRSGCYRTGAFLFAGIFLTAPVFAEQFLFVLQAFESAVAMLLCVLTSYCSGRWIYDRGSMLWALLAVIFMTWAFGSYQAYPAFYIALVLLSYIIVYIHRESSCGLREGLMHAGLFLAGFTASQLFSRLVCTLAGASSSYVESMFSWGIQDLETCIAGIREDFYRIYRGTWPLFFSRYFLQAGMAASVLALYHGWKKKSRKFPCFLLALILLSITPVLITLITATPQPIRGQMTYPLVWASYILLLYTGLASLSSDRNIICFFRKAGCGAMVFGTILLGWRQGIHMSQLWETAHEQYVSDAFTANRMYEDICRTADRSDMEHCKVVFVGTRAAKLGGSPVIGDVIGHSFFEWDASSSIGVSLRVNTFFETLGLFMEVPAPEDYEYALELCAGRPVWPASDSVFLTEEGIVVVKLSEDEP